MQTKLRSSYTGHYRRGLIGLLDTLEFRSNNDIHRPVIEALNLNWRTVGANESTSDFVIVWSSILYLAGLPSKAYVDLCRPKMGASSEFPGQEVIDMCT